MAESCPEYVSSAEHQDVEAPAGRDLRQVALEAGIWVNREYFKGLTCGGRGVCGSCKVWVGDKAGTLSPATALERMHGAGKGRRLACQAKVLGDLEVTTMPGGADRLDPERPIAATPQPSSDENAPRKPADEAMSIAHRLGHPDFVGCHPTDGEG